MLGRLRMATLRGDSETQGTLINAVLGVYLRNSMYVEADKFFSKVRQLLIGIAQYLSRDYYVQVTFPESANNNELARYVFYTGRIKAMLFEYTAAQQYLAQALRKAPQSDAVALGFKQAVSSNLCLKCKLLSCC